MHTPRKVAFLDQAHPFLFQHLTELGYACEHHEKTPQEEFAGIIDQFFGISIRSRFRLEQDLLAKAPDLAFIARHGVGVEHIDVEFAESQGTVVLTSPEGSKDTVAEHSIGMLLMLMSKLGLADRQIRAGQWIRAANRAIELKDKTVGIIGYGNMGSALAQRLQGFGVKTLAYDKFKKGFGNPLAEEVPLERIWAEADIISLHIPYLPENHYFLNDAFLQSCQKPVYVLNTARGTVLNTADLVKNLQSGKVLGAALDVFEYEEHSFENLDPFTLPEPFQYLRQADNVVLTPHLGGSSLEAIEGHSRVLAQKIEELFGSGDIV
jgi:D-3-phosphoglycerate dehydrogenase